MGVTSENTFETAIIESLVTSGGYAEGEAGELDGLTEAGIKRGKEEKAAGRNNL